MKAVRTTSDRQAGAGGAGGPESARSSDTIWRDHFGLVSEPFALTPDPAFFYLGEVHAEALAGLKLGLMERRGLLVLVGEVGTGKTTVAYSLLSSLDTSIETAYISNTSLTVDELLGAALRDLGVEGTMSSRLDLLDALNAILDRCAAKGRSVAIVIDEAQNLTDRGFEELRLLLNYETFKAKLLQIVLVGQPELGARLQRHGLRQLADRVAVRCVLEPLDRRETREYVGHRLRAVGGSADIFTRPAMSLLARRSRGFPRRVNIIAHNAMLLAYGKGDRAVHRSAVAEAVRDDDWKRRRSSSRHSRQKSVGLA